MANELRIETTPIDGLLLVHLPLHGDARGWFKEHWQRAKMTALGLPDFGPVQQNVSYNTDAGVTRGLHAEPWDKYVSVAAGEAFGAWVDLREGPGHGTVFTHPLRPDVAVYVPRGVANGYQTLHPDTAYMYLVNDHWSPQADYTLINLADPALGIHWPIPLDQATISDKDRAHPALADTQPVPPLKTVVLGANGQLGRALHNLLGEDHITYLTRDDLDLTDPAAITGHDWTGVGAIINAAAYTAVDEAETLQGRRDAWAINATAVRDLAHICIQHRITLVHVSTDYVFDGENEEHPETEPVSPLNTYGASKAAGELAASLVPHHYIIRTSWVIGDGPNFIRTMTRLAHQGARPKVINDQRGRLTGASDLAAAIQHLLHHRPVPGIYNATSTGPVQTWYDIARDVYQHAGANPDDVTPVSTADYTTTRRANGPIAPRPLNSQLPLDKIRATGFHPDDRESVSGQSAESFQGSPE